MKKRILPLAALLAVSLSACVPGSLRNVIGNSWKNEPLVKLVGQNISVVTSRVGLEREESLLGYVEYVLEYCGQTGRVITSQDYSGQYYSRAESVCGSTVFRTDKGGKITAYYERGSYDARPNLMNKLGDLVK